jgi:hypothetical protein
VFTLKVECDAAPAERRGSAGVKAVQTWRDLSGAVCAFGYAGPGWWEMEWPKLAAFRFGPALDRTVRAFAEPGVQLDRIEEVYRRSVLPLAFQALGSETLHASAVTCSRGVLAFCGERGAGKSTVAYALARRGFAQHADDTLVLTVTPRDVTTYPLPFIPRLRPASSEFFNASPHAESSALHSGTAPESLAAVFILRQSDVGGTVVTPLAPAAAFRAVLAHAHSFDPEDASSRERLLRNYLEMSARVPMFDVAYEPRLGGLDALLEAMLAAAGEYPPSSVAR